MDRTVYITREHLLLVSSKIKQKIQVFPSKYLSVRLPYVSN
jgi:hypothetical protein